MIVLNSTLEVDREGTALLPDLMPLLDVVLIVIVFMILTANSEQQALDLTLPATDAAATLQARDDPRITFSVYPEGGGWSVGGHHLMDWKAVQSNTARAHAAQPDLPWVIAADRDVSVERFLDALVLLQSQGLTTAQILVRQTGEGATGR